MTARETFPNMNLGSASMMHHALEKYCQTPRRIWRTSGNFGLLDLAGESNEAMQQARFGSGPHCETNVSTAEYLKVVSNRIVHGRAYLWLYCIILVAIVMEMVTAVLWFEDHVLGLEPFVITLMALVHLLMFAEITLRMAAHGTRYWSQCSNTFDFAILCLGMTAFIALLASRHYQIFLSAEDDFVAIDTVLMMARTIYMLIRLSYLWAYHWRITSACCKDSTDDVNFETIIEASSCDDARNSTTDVFATVSPYGAHIA